MIEKRIDLNKLIEQGDIYKDIKLLRNIQVGEDAISVDEVDFKYFFTADMSQFSKEKYVSSIKPCYREELSHNFASYLSRIGIPIIGE